MSVVPANTVACGWWGLRRPSARQELRRHLALDPMQVRQLRGLELRIFIRDLHGAPRGGLRHDEFGDAHHRGSHDLDWPSRAGRFVNCLHDQLTVRNRKDDDRNRLKARAGFLPARVETVSF
jgi:hypothetical protein